MFDSFLKDACMMEGIVADSDCHALVCSRMLLCKKSLWGVCDGTRWRRGGVCLDKTVFPDMFDCLWCDGEKWALKSV